MFICSLNAAQNGTIKKGYTLHKIDLELLLNEKTAKRRKDHPVSCCLGGRGKHDSCVIFPALLATYLNAIYLPYW